MEPQTEVPWPPNQPLVDAGAEQPITFMDTVRVRATEETQAAGIAGLVGIVYGDTIPSKSGQDVLLTPAIDYAVGVHLDELDRTVFLPRDVLEFIDHGLGRELRLKTRQGWASWVRLENAEWRQVEESTEFRATTGAHGQPEQKSLIRRLLRFLKLKR